MQYITDKAGNPMHRKLQCHVPTATAVIQSFIYCNIIVECQQATCETE